MSPSTNYEKALVPYHGSPFLSQLSNAMLHSIEGNSCITKATVICIGETHSDTTQKPIRAQIINEIFSQSELFGKPHFLIEGVEGLLTQASNDQYLFERVIGTGMIKNAHTVSGWDNVKLRDKQYSIIGRIQLLYLKFQQSQNAYEQKEALDAIDSCITLTEKNASDRDVVLEQSLRSAIKTHPNSPIVLIAGKQHIRALSKKITDIKHAILNTRGIESKKNGFELLDDLYGGL